MADVIALRTTLRAAQAALDTAQQRFDQLTNQADDPAIPAAIRQALRAEMLAQGRVVGRLTTTRDAALTAYQAAVLADPMHLVDTGVPLVLLPVRIETAYLPGVQAGTDLVVRVYPDDIHVDAHEPELTSIELADGTAYWQAVWGAGANTARLDNAWHALLGSLKPARAAWVVRALAPTTPRPTVETPLDQPQPEPLLPAVARRPGTFNRAPHTTLLPDHWHVIGVRGGAELFNVDGGPIPDTLGVSFGPPGTGAVASDLPFDARSRWLVDLDAALAAGMAVRIPLSGPDLSIDQLFVVGVMAQIAPDEGARRLESTFLAHQYTNGLGFLPPGTPTNNTSASRSAWQSAPESPSPAAVDEARAAYQPASLQNAALAARALGIDGTEALSVAPNGLFDQQSSVLALQRQLWNALGGKTLSLLFTHWDIPPGAGPTQGGWHLHNDPAQSAALAEHVIGWVRSRGTLPVLRVGNQPYGLLPTSSLADWAIAANDPLTQMIGWLRQLRPYWLAGVANAPRVVPVRDPNPDVTVVNVLSRLPVSNGVMLRADGDPFVTSVANRPFPVAPIPGLPVTSELFLAAPANSAQPSPVPVVGDAAADHRLMLFWRDLFADSVAVLAQTMSSQDWITKYQSLFGVGTPPNSPPPDLFMTMLQDSITDPLGPSAGIGPSNGESDNQVGAQVVLGAFFSQQQKDDPNFQKFVQHIVPLGQTFVAHFDVLCAADPGSYDGLLREVLDVFSHRIDAWVTSLAARRIEQQRAARPTGVVIGAYGWVEDLRPRTDLTPVAAPPAGLDNLFTSPLQKYIHAPSLHHAATAAVLRAGYDSHPNPDALAVNLVSRRVRVADWLAAGVRNGQTLGALLGYRFERGLHDASLDGLIERLRKAHPLPLPTGPDADANGLAAREAIAARNVVDGLDLYRQRASVPAEFQDQPAALPKIGELLNDLADAVDALGDLLLAESVHHLVGGNPLRAGLAADTIGRGEPVPERFDVVRTPRSGRAVTWQTGALLAASWQSPSAGWTNGRPRARLEPHVNAWVAAFLGDASRWQIAASVTTGDGVMTSVRIGLDTLGLAPLDVVAEVSGHPSQLERRIVDAVTAAQPGALTVIPDRAPAGDGTLGLGELLGLAARIRALLATAAPLGPQHVEGPDTSPVLGIDIAELDGRIAAFQASFAAAVAQLGSAAQALSDAAAADPATLLAAALAVRAALVTLADHGVGSAYPGASTNDGAAMAAALSPLAAAMLANFGPLAAAAPPAAPGAGAPPPDVQRWLTAVSDYVQGIAGRVVPIVTTYLLPPGSTYAASFAPGATPAGADEPTVMAWLRRVARVHPPTAALHDVLMVDEALGGSAPGLAVAQLPVEAGARWAALPFGDVAPPKARLVTVVSAPASVDPATAFCGLVFDAWTEQLPGLTSLADRATGHESAEVTGVAFSVDAPSAYPPQAVLLAVAPDPAIAWSLDILYDVLQETLEMAKMRTVDLGDLPRLGRVLPAVHSGSNLDTVLASAGLHQ